MVTSLVTRRRRGWAVGQRRGQVLLLQGGADPLGPHVGHQELQPGPGAHPPVAVVPEQAGHGVPDLGDPVGRHEGAEPDPQLRVGRQAAADPQVVAGTELGVNDTDERDVVDLVQRAVVGAAGDGAFELARQVAQGLVAHVAPDGLLDRRGGVDDLVAVDAGERAAENDAGGVTACLGRRQPGALERRPDRRHVLDADPVELDVLPVGDVGDVPPVAGGDPGDDAELVAGQPATVEADALHEERRLELLGLQDGCLAAVDTLPALGVQPPPAEPPPKILGIDAGEARVRVTVEDPVPDGQAVLVLLHPLVGVEGLQVAKRPLALPLRTGRARGTGACGGRHRISRNRVRGAPTTCRQHEVARRKGQRRKGQM